MTDFNTCFLTPFGSLLLPQGRLAYPSLFEKRGMPGETDPKKLKFSTALIMPVDSDLRIAHDYVEKMIAEKWGNNPTKPVRRPWIKHRDKTADLDLAAAFPHMVRTSTNTKPNVVVYSSNANAGPDDVYAGRWARISVQGWCWEHVATGRGLSFTLNNVMLLDHDDVLTGGRPKPEDEFASMMAERETANVLD